VLRKSLKDKVIQSIRCIESRKLVLLSYPRVEDTKQNPFFSLRLRDLCMGTGQYTFLMSQFKGSKQLGALG